MLYGSWSGKERIYDDAHTADYEKINLFSLLTIYINLLRLSFSAILHISSVPPSLTDTHHSLVNLR